MTIRLQRLRIDVLRSSSLSEPLPALDQAPAGVRLTSAFVAEFKQLGSRAARLAILQAYEDTHGDDWCLRVTVVDRTSEPLQPDRLIRGLLEFEQSIIRLVDGIAERTDASIVIRPEPTATRRPARRNRGDVAALSRTVQRPDSTRTDTPSIVETDTPTRTPRRKQCRP